MLAIVVLIINICLLILYDWLVGIIIFIQTSIRNSELGSHYFMFLFVKTLDFLVAIWYGYSPEKWTSVMPASRLRLMVLEIDDRISKYLFHTYPLPHYFPIVSIPTSFNPSINSSIFCLPRSL